MFEEYKEEQEIIDRFVRGEYTPNEFFDIYIKNNKLIDLLEKKYELIENDDEKLSFISSIYGKINRNHYPTVRSQLEWFISLNTFYGRGSFYDCIYNIEITFNRKIIKYYRWDKEFNFAINAVPDYLDGSSEVEPIIREIIDKLPADLPEKKRIKLCKDEIKKAFFIEGNKYPHWIQSSEWPLSKEGKPTKYLRTETREGGEVKAYIFLDVDTNEEIIVEQCY